MLSLFKNTSILDFAVHNVIGNYITFGIVANIWVDELIILM